MKEPIEDLRRYADHLASEVSPVAAQRAVAAAFQREVRRPRRTIVALVTTGVFALSNVALAATANPSVPGDLLYGVDRAYERVVDVLGSTNPRVVERIQESNVLVERGELGAALDLVQETLSKVLESTDPAGELELLVESVGGMPEEVADLVAVARAVGRSEDVSGADVAALARTLVDRIERRPEHAGTPNDNANPNSTAPQAPNENANPNSTAPRIPNENANPDAGANQP